METPAPWLRRLLADLIDLLAISLLILLFSLALGLGLAASALAETAKQALAFWGPRLILLLIPWLYFASLERTLGDQTFGKSALGLQAQRTDRRPLGFWRSALRAFLKLALLVTWPLVLAGRPPLYDRLLSTEIVVRPRSDPHRR